MDLYSNPESSIGVVWVDARQALVATAPEGRSRLTKVERAADTEIAFMLRIARMTADCDRLIVMGPDAAKLAFERECVALYRRPDRVMDMAAELMPDPDALIAQLRRLDAPGA
jgi:hypothetical protein